eukprot:TRINITY_DN28593_c0_g1_i1.p1 TRINITY_DN28593_c0_g1~~TRINITY_DN28593_c0_g1_i1.p1  ORF type:complete len:369 (-),score=101.04 TRINITY_DN28593_c0_g1_i1:222-1328(-)
MCIRDRGMPQLTHLILSGNGIGGGGDDAGCKLIGEYLSTNPRLETLSLFHNGLTDPCVVPLVNALRRNTHLAFLNLDMNELSNGSWMMFHKAILGGKAKNTSLVSLQVGCTSGIVPSERIVEELEQQLADNRVSYSQRKLKDEAARRRAILQAHQEKNAQQQQAERDEEASNQLRERALEMERAVLEEEEAARLADEALETQRGKMKTKDQRKQEKEEWALKAVEEAYAWRNRLTGNGTLVKEWRDGFTTLKASPNDTLGSKPSVTMDGDRRLKACWCDPRDVSAPYAKTLHYHCRHEQAHMAKVALSHDGKVPKYCGCRASGHACASIGFFCDPLPDRSAAFFFASQARSGGGDGAAGEIQEEVYTS